MKKNLEWLKEQMNRPIYGEEQFMIGYDKAVEKFNGLVDQLDEIEVSSQELEEEQRYIVILGKSIYNTTTYGQIGEVNSKKIMQSIYASKENIIIPNQYTKSEILEVKDGEDIFKRYAVKVGLEE